MSLTAHHQSALLELAKEEGVDLCFEVRGDCMVPILEEGDRIEVSKKSVYWPGDVVAFVTEEGQSLVHRVLGYRRRSGGWQMVTGSDAASGFDDPIASARCLGRVTGLKKARSAEARGSGSTTAGLIDFDDFKPRWSHRVRAVARFLRLGLAALVRRIPGRRSG